MLGRFARYLDEQQLCQKDDRVLVACSGGLDSMALLDLFLKSGYRVGVAHANYGLRGSESDGDEAFVSAYCREKDIPFHLRRFDVSAYAELTGQSIQMAGRELRYTWFGEILEKGEYQAVATGHQLNDNLETVIMRMVRGTGIDGLQGIPPKRGRVIRPLLFAARKDIEAYAKSAGLSWREDSSNSEDKYHRNLVRNRVVPLLRELNPALESTFGDTLMRFKAAEQLTELGLQSLRQQYLSSKSGVWSVPFEFLKKWSSPAILQMLLEDFGFSLRVCGEITGQSAAQPGKRFYSDSHVLTVDRSALVVQPRGGEWDETIIESGTDTVELGPWKMTVRVGDQPAVSSSVSVATLDMDKLRFPLTWRKWRPGDSFVPLGMTGRKKVSDLLIDRKLSRVEKDQATVILSTGEIAWVAGQRVSDHFKITPATRAGVQLELSPRFEKL